MQRYIPLFSDCEYEAVFFFFGFNAKAKIKEIYIIPFTLSLLTQAVITLNHLTTQAI